MGSESTFRAGAPLTSLSPHLAGTTVRPTGLSLGYPWTPGRCSVCPGLGVGRSAPAGSTYGARCSGGCGAAGGSCTLGSAAFPSGGCGLTVEDAAPLPTPPACPEAPGRVAQARAFPRWTWRSCGVQGAWILVLSQLSVNTEPAPQPTPPLGGCHALQGQDRVPTPWQPRRHGPTAQVPPALLTFGGRPEQPTTAVVTPRPFRAQSVPQKPEASSQTLGVTSRSDGRLLLP